MSIAKRKMQFTHSLEGLSEMDIHEVIDFIEYLKRRKEKQFIDYVNQRTEQALAEREKGKKFYTLEELQEEYGDAESILYHKF